MAITNTGTGKGTDANPPGAFLVTWSLAKGDLIMVSMEIGFNNSNQTVSDNVNTGNYTKIAGVVDTTGNVLNIYMMVMQSSAAASTLTITPNIGADNVVGQIYVATFTGFQGTPTADAFLGPVTQTLPSNQAGNTNFSLFNTLSTNYSAEVAMIVVDTQATQISGVPNDGQGHNWTDFTGIQESFYRIISAKGSTYDFTAKLAAAPNAVTTYVLASVYDALIPKVIQDNFGSSGSSVTSFSLAYAGAVSTANTMIVVVSTFSPNISFTLSDSVNGAWGSAVYALNVGGRSLYIFSFPPSNGGGTPTVTATASAGATISMCLMEVSQLTGTTDQRVTANAGSGATSSSVGPTGPLASINEFSLSVIQLGTTSGTWAAGGSYTLLEPTSGNSGQGVAYFVPTDVSAQTATFTWATATGYLAAVVTFNTIAGNAYLPFTQTTFFVSDRLTMT